MQYTAGMKVRITTADSLRKGEEHVIYSVDDPEGSCPCGQRCYKVYDLYVKGWHLWYCESEVEGV